MFIIIMEHVNSLVCFKWSLYDIDIYGTVEKAILCLEYTFIICLKDQFITGFGLFMGFADNKKKDGISPHLSFNYNQLIIALNAQGRDIFHVVGIKVYDKTAP